MMLFAQRERSAEDSLCTRELRAQGVVGVQHRLKLLGVRQSRVSDVYNRLILSDLGAIIKTDHLRRSVLKFYT